MVSGQDALRVRIAKLVDPSFLNCTEIFKLGRADQFHSAWIDSWLRQLDLDCIKRQILDQRSRHHDETMYSGEIGLRSDRNPCLVGAIQAHGNRTRVENHCSCAGLEW